MRAAPSVACFLTLQDMVHASQDRAVRTTKQSEGSTDAVAILALLKEEGGAEKVVLVKQFRPPVNGCDSMPPTPGTFRFASCRC